MTNELEVIEKTELEQNEAIIKNGLDTFVEVGAALLVIRDKRLYRAEYSTFEDYCKSKWGMSSRQSNRLIQSAEVTENLRPIGLTLPETESQTRPLAALPFDKQAEVWRKVVETAPEGKITAAYVQQVVNEDKGLKTCDIDPRHIWTADIVQCPYCTKTAQERIEWTKQEIIKPHVAHNSGENEWYTPVKYIDAARAVMGGIDIDPASSKIANKTVGAKRFYTKEDDGLDKEWTGRVWMNPPYDGKLIKLFVTRYVEGVKIGEITEGIVLVNNATETEWFSDLVSVSAAVVFTFSRVKFLDPNGIPGAPLQGQALVYAGNNQNKFIKEFSSFGWAAKLC